MKKKDVAKFVAGAAVGVGIGLLFAPKKGSELRKDLKNKLDEFVQQLKDIDIKEVKEEFDKKVAEIKSELADLDKEKVLEIAKKKVSDLKNKAEELVDLAKAKGTPVLKKTANDILEKVIKISKETQKKLEVKE